MQNLDNKHELALSWTKLEEGHTSPVPCSSLQQSMSASSP